MEDPEAKPKRFDIRNIAKKGASKARKRAKKIFTARTEWGYALMAIYLILVSGAGMSLVLSVIPSFFAPDLDDGLRNGVEAKCPTENDFQPALEVGLGTAAAWDWMLIGFSLYSVVLAVTVAFVYIFFIRKKEKLAWQNDKDSDTCKEKDAAVDAARIAYYVLMALVLVSFILTLTLFIKYMVILTNSNAGTDISNDADAFIIYWAVLTGISAASSLIYAGFLLSQAMTIKNDCTPSANLPPPPPPEEYFADGGSRMNPWSSSVMTAPFPGFNRRTTAFQH